MISRANTKTCLVIKNDGIGDLILSSGLIADLNEQYPNGVDLVTCTQNQEIAESIPGLRKRLYVSRNGLIHNRMLGRLGIRYIRPCAQDKVVLAELERTHYAVAISLRRYITQSTLILMRATQAEKRYCGWLFPTNASREMAEENTRGWIHYRGPLEHRSELSYYRGFLKEALGIESNSPPALTIARRNPKVGPEIGRIGLSLGGNSANWPVEHWVELVRGLAGSGKKLVLFGGTDARALAEKIKHAAPSIEDLTGRLTFVDSTRQLERLELLVGNDTGFTHYASLVVPRVVVILGGGTFGRFFPWPEAANQHVIYRAMDCYDCDWQCRFPRLECLHAVGPEAVLRLAGAASSTRSLNLCPTNTTYRAGWRRLPGGCGIIELPGRQSTNA